MTTSEFELYRVPMELSGEPTRYTVVALDISRKDNSKKVVVIFAATRTELGHYALVTLAEECGAIPEEAAPTGGAIVDARTGQTIRDSVAFFEIRRDMLETIISRIETGNYKECLGDEDTGFDEEDDEEWLKS